MTTEIELKYLILSDDTKTKIIDLLAQQKVHHEFSEKQLRNSYFDTADLALRTLDMGLRVREQGHHIEQTIKTSGRVVGGLHARPEYNVDIDSHFPELNLFPENIWAETQSVDNIQKGLIKLFSTDFTRHAWQVTDESGNVIELVLDEGLITSKEQSEVIYELELELIKGDKSALFDFAELLFTVLELRVGLKSKAARGYRLWQESQEITHNNTMSFICDSSTNSVTHVFTQGLEQGLTNLQKSIEQFLLSESLTDLEQIKTSLAILRHGFWLFESSLAPSELEVRDELSHFIHLLAWVEHAIYLQELTTKKGNYRKKLDFSKQLIEQLKIEKRRFPDLNDIKQLLHSARFNQLQLTILKLFLQRSENSENASISEHQQLLSFAQEKIQFSLTELNSEMKSMNSLTCEQYIGLSKLLYRSLLTGTWLAGLFDNELRDKFRRPWLDLQQGIAELQTLWIIQQQLTKLDEPPKKLVNWQMSKVEGLLMALDNTKSIAIEITPYWYE